MDEPSERAGRILADMIRSSDWLAAHDRNVAAKALEDAASRILLNQHPVSIIQQLERRAAVLRATPSTETNGTH